MAHQNQPHHLGAGLFGLHGQGNQNRPVLGCGGICSHCRIGSWCAWHWVHEPHCMGRLGVLSQVRVDGKSCLRLDHTMQCISISAADSASCDSNQIEGHGQGRGVRAGGGGRLAASDKRTTKQAPCGHARGPSTMGAVLVAMQCSGWAWDMAVCFRRDE
jgi:hypothetical protein